MFVGHQIVAPFVMLLALTTAINAILQTVLRTFRWKTSHEQGTPRSLQG